LAVNSRDKHSRTPLHLAAWSGQSQVVSYLCKNKADVGAAAMDDMGAIHFAAQKGHLDVVRTLVSSGVSVKSANRKGLTPLHYAVQGSYLDLIKYLVKKGSDLTAKTKAGKIPLDLAKSDEVRLVLTESEKEFKKGGSGIDEKGEKEDVLEGEVKESENEGNELGKRKNDEKDDSEKKLPEPRRVKVVLDHLVAEDDGEEEANEEGLEGEVKERENEENESGKRKNDEKDDSEKILPEPKRAKVVLDHLVAEDDGEEEANV
jgi:hypothetical protein